MFWKVGSSFWLVKIFKTQWSEMCSWNLNLFFLHTKSHASTGRSSPELSFSSQLWTFSVLLRKSCFGKKKENLKMWDTTDANKIHQNDGRKFKCASVTFSGRGKDSFVKLLKGWNKLLMPQTNVDELLSPGLRRQGTTWVGAGIGVLCVYFQPVVINSPCNTQMHHDVKYAMECSKHQLFNNLPK